MATKTTKPLAEDSTAVDSQLPLLNPPGADTDELFARFSSEITDAGLQPVEVDLIAAGRIYKGPAVLVRDLSLVQKATNLLTVTVAGPNDTIYVIPVLEPVELN